MKKSIICFVSLVIFCFCTRASSVHVSVAQNTATSFYKKHSRIPVTGTTLAYSEITTAGDTLYYVFNINQEDGFVIIAAEDASLPVLGYSTRGHYGKLTLPENFKYWMQSYKEQLMVMKQSKMEVNQSVKNKWRQYSSSNISARTTQADAILSVSSVGPLVSTTWDQTAYYNMLCPGGTPTGCVATAMAQVMKYWNYPAKGIGSNTIPGFRDPSYGTLSANFAATSYNWQAMPVSLSSSSTPKEDSAVAVLMYDCGVSVNMVYNASGSSAGLTLYDGYSFCAQAALVNYFGYDAFTVNGIQKNNFTDSIWVSILKNELDNKRPMLLSGVDTIHGGHAWVCDGYDTDSMFHMNWGWSGAYDAYFAVSNLNPDGFHLNSYQEAIIGIKPPYGTKFTAAPLVSCSSATVNFTDQSTSAGTISSRKWLFPGGTPPSSLLQNPVVTYNSPGFYDVTEIINSTSGIDTLTRSACVAVESATALPVNEGFQESTFPPRGWYLNNPDNYNYTWQQNTTTGGKGKSSKCLFFDNCSPNQSIYGERQQLYSPVYDFTATKNEKMWFDIAYAPVSNTSSDTLAIYYSLDCGKTFSLVYLKGGMDLGTAGGSVTGGGVNTTAGGCFVPLDNNWRTDTIHLNALSGQGAVMFSFENRSGYGSDMYIDNITIPNSTISTALAEDLTENFAKIFPNPTSGSVALMIQNPITQNTILQVTDVLGKIILSQHLINGQTTFNINITSYPQGIYFMRVINENNAWTTKLIKN